MFRSLALLSLPAFLLAGTGSELGKAIVQAGLDPQECYRVRELHLDKDDARFFFTDGYLIFGKPAGNARVSALFTTDVEGGDAELLLLPPNRGERRSLAFYANSPNLDEHFNNVMMLFADGTYAQLLEQIQSNPSNRKSPEMGVLLAEKWSSVAANIGSSFETRLVLDLLAAEPQKRAFFVAAVQSRQLGNFDVMFDPRASEQLIAGQIATHGGRMTFDFWTSFVSRSFRGAEPPPEFTVSDFRIESTLQPDLRLESTTRVKARLPSAERVLPFDISPRMRVTSATVDGEPAEVLQRESVRESFMENGGDDLFLVVAAHPLDPGRDHEVEIRHQGKVVFDAGNHVYYVGSRASWYPHRGQQFARFDLTFRYPKDLDVVSAGQVLEDRVEGTTRITRRATDAPIRSAGFNLGAYERTRISRGGLTVEVCANRQAEKALQPPKPIAWPEPPLSAVPHRGRRPDPAPTIPMPENPAPTPASQLQNVADDIGGALEFFASKFGPPPLQSIEVSPIPGRFGQGFAGMIYLSTLSYLSQSDRALTAMTAKQQLFFRELLYAHEAAHQWWGNVVTQASYHDEWIMEALANYSALLYLEKRKGAAAAADVLEEYRRQLLKDQNGQTVESAGPVVQGIRLESSQTPEAWQAIVYGKGTWIIHMLRRRMGDERFPAMLAELRRKYEKKGLTTEEFRLHCASFMPPKSSDGKLESFFDQWVYGTGIPELKLAYSVKGKVPALKLTGTVTQSGVDEDFSTAVPIEIQTGRGRSATQWVRTSTEPAAFSAALRAAPSKVLLDPGNAVLHR